MCLFRDTHNICEVGGDKTVFAYIVNDVSYGMKIKHVIFLPERCDIWWGRGETPCPEGHQIEKCLGFLNRFFVAVKSALKKLHDVFVQRMFDSLLDIVLADEEKLFWPQLFLPSKVKGLPLQRTSFCLIIIELPALCNNMSKKSHTWFYGQINLFEIRIKNTWTVKKSNCSPRYLDKTPGMKTWSLLMPVSRHYVSFFCISYNCIFCFRRIWKYRMPYNHILNLEQKTIFLSKKKCIFQNKWKVQGCTQKVIQTLYARKSCIE